MSGHSHWAGIKHKKGLEDAKRAKIFTRLAKPIVIAAREGGGNPETNFKLRMAIDKAKAFNMPKDNIEKAIKRGTGELKGNLLEEIVYEAVGPGGIMLIIKTTTDNRNRTVSEIKSILTKNGGKMSEQGSSLWNFNLIGLINIQSSIKNTDELELIAIDAGAQDIKIESDYLSIITDSKKLQTVQKKLAEQKEVTILEAKLAYLPKSIATINKETQLAYKKLLIALDNQDDIDEIYDNL